jgi:outer membrane protein assembly factor BamB
MDCLPCPLKGLTALLTVASFLIAGCGGGDDPAPDEGTGNPPAISTSESGNFQADAAHSGVSPAPTPTFPLQQAWQRTFAGAVSYPVIAGGKVFVVVTNVVGGGQAQLVAIDQATGVDAWPAISIGTTYYASLVHHEGRIIVIGSDGILRSFDTASGAAGWSTVLSFFTGTPPTAYKGKIYVATGNMTYAVAAQSGAIVWTAPTSQSSPSLGGGNVLLNVPCSSMSVGESTGVERWRMTTAPCSGGAPGTIVWSAGKTYERGFDFVTSRPTLIQRDADTGTALGSANVFGLFPLSTPAVSADAAYVLNGGTLQRFDPSLQSVAWSFAGDGSLASAPLVLGDVVLIGGWSGKLYALDVRTGSERWSALLPSGIEHPNDVAGLGSTVTGMAAANGILVVPAGRTLNAWRLTPP